MRCLQLIMMCVLILASGVYSGEPPVPLHKPGELFRSPTISHPLYDPDAPLSRDGSFGEDFNPPSPRYPALYDPTVIPQPGGSFGEDFKPYSSQYAPLFDPADPGLPGGYWTEPSPDRLR